MATWYVLRTSGKYAVFHVDMEKHSIFCFGESGEFEKLEQALDWIMLLEPTMDDVIIIPDHWKIKVQDLNRHLTSRWTAE